MQRPTLSHHLAAHPHDPARALDAYRAALAEWRCEADPLPRRPPRPVAAMAIGAAVIVLALAVAAALGALTGCSGPDPSPGGACVIGRSAVCGEGSETAACKTCVEGCEE